MGGLLLGALFVPGASRVAALAGGGPAATTGSPVIRVDSPDPRPARGPESIGIPGTGRKVIPFTNRDMVGRASAAGPAKGPAEGSIGSWQPVRDTNGPRPPHEEGDPPRVPGGGCNSRLAWDTTVADNESTGPVSTTPWAATVNCSGQLDYVWHQARAVDRTSGYDGNLFGHGPAFSCQYCPGGAATAALEIFGDRYDGGRQYEILLEIILVLPPWAYWQSCGTPPGLRLYSCTGEGGQDLHVLVGTGPQSSKLAAPVIRYVALGDSYASGSGAPPYRAGDPSACHRSDQAYPLHLVSTVIDGLPVDRPTFKACHGARIEHLFSTQAGAEKPQVDWLNKNRTRLVTLSIGGNDLGFRDILEACLIPAHDCSANGPLIPESRWWHATGNLTLLLDYIRRNMRSDGYIVVLSYPLIMPIPGNPADRYPVGCAGFTESEAHAMVLATIRARDMVQRAVSDAGGRANNIVFVDVLNALEGHRLCSADRWAHGFDLPLSESFQSYHPTARGQTAMADIVRRELAGLVIG